MPMLTTDEHDKSLYLIEHMRRLLIDFITMADNECERIKTGHASGPSMRDCIGQWEATIRDARKLLKV